jgi:hypothetical protein
MPYFCKACSYRGNASDAGGACPACGSFNVSGGRVAQAATEEPLISARWRIVLLAGLWSVLIVMVVWKLAQTT